MNAKEIYTEFAPAERADIKKLAFQQRILEQNSLLNIFSDAVSKMILILNKERQIIYANKPFLDLLELQGSQTIIGKRPGEAVNCVHADQLEGGCGTTEFCRQCGAVNAILQSQKGMQSEKECHILTKDNDAFDLMVTATPFVHENETFTIFAISDISHEKRKEILERVFFHDVLNSAGGISGLSSILQESMEPEEISEISSVISQASDMLVDEIKSQRILNSAENGNLETKLTETDSITIIKEMADIYSKHNVVTNKIISIDSKSDNINIITDTVLLRRVLGNLIKNALEASMPKGTVTIGCSDRNGTVRFSVHNNTYMEREIQLQLFKRSFSTKGYGRGIGTYSIKLFGEKYLKGKVGFESTRENGTTFFIEIPICFPDYIDKHS